jgi:hypothetical protein
MYPRQSHTTHTEQLGDEVSVYDSARAKVHALNPTAARVWIQCDGVTSPTAMAGVLRREMGILEADAVVDLALRQLARVHLLELPVESGGDPPATTRRWLLGRGVTAAMLPAIYSILVPTPLEAQSPGRAAPTLTGVSPNQGIRGTTVAVTLTGTNFIAGATSAAVAGGGVTVTSVTVGSATSLTANFVLDAAASDGPRTVTVTTANGTSGGQTFTISPPPAAPTLSAISPAQGTQGSTVAVTLTGTNLRLVIAGFRRVNVSGTGITVTVTGTEDSDTSLTANFAIDAAAPVGARNVTVTTAGGTSAFVTFAVNAPAAGAPTLTAISPAQGTQGATVAVTLTGTNFVAGATTVTISGAGVTVSNVTVASTTSLTANFAVDTAAAVGARNVTVTTTGGTSAPVSFTVNPPAPTLTAISPTQGTQSATVAVMLTGTNFIAGATTVSVSATGVTVNNVVVGSTTSLTASFVLDAAAAVGVRNVTVTTAGGTSAPVSFTVNPPSLGVPTLTTISPAQGTQGATVAVTLTGTNFVVGATTVSVSGAGVTVNNVVVGSTTSLTVSFVLDAAAAVGVRNVTVTTAGGSSAPVSFTVNSSAPTLTAISPAQGFRGLTVAVTLTGTNFVVGGTTVTVSGTGVAVTNVVVTNTTSLTASFVLDPISAAGGPRMVTVTTALGTSGPQTFTIIDPPAPTLTAISPAQGILGTTVAVTLTGTNFIVGGTIVQGIPTNSVVVVSATSLTANFVLDPAGVTIGANAVTVRTTGGTSGPASFTVVPPAPNLTSVAPNFGNPGQTVPVTLTGTNFVVGATTVTVSGTVVSVNNVVVGSPTSLTANFVINAAATGGSYVVTVTTAGGISLPRTFSVTAV